jgi:hypothetical protein
MSESTTVASDAFFKRSILWLYLVRIFTRQDGARPVYGSSTKFQKDPLWRDLILFYEYFHGDNGAGIGASHQTGWTGLVARLIQITVSGLFEFPDKPDDVERPAMRETRGQEPSEAAVSAVVTPTLTR